MPERMHQGSPGRLGIVKHARRAVSDGWATSTGDGSNRSIESLTGVPAFCSDGRPFSDIIAANEAVNAFRSAPTRVSRAVHPYCSPAKQLPRWWSHRLQEGGIATNREPQRTRTMLDCACLLEAGASSVPL